MNLSRQELKLIAVALNNHAVEKRDSANLPCDDTVELVAAREKDRLEAKASRNLLVKVLHELMSQG